ncbi:MAG: CSLREA domain-containing protein, partial [Chloroflexales bacterium]|nr:CSLREA domain-containing protein [Chloroflexales bacterium]
MKQIPFDPSRIKVLHITVCAMMIVGLVLNVGVPVAHAATITVNTFDDELNNDGDCSLREAIQAANTDSPVDACAGDTDPDTITLRAGTYTLSLPGVNENAGATGDLDITSTNAVTITGAGAGTTIINAGDTNVGVLGDRVFEVRPNANLTISGVTIRGGDSRISTGSTVRNGGGILNSGGTLTVTDSIISGNNAGYGGG